MPKKSWAYCLLAFATATLAAQDPAQPILQIHQAPDEDGVYYAGPEVAAPKMVRTFSVPYPYDIPAKEIQGMTVMAMVIDAQGKPQHIQILHKHGDRFDDASIAAVRQSTFEPGTLAGKPVPVWIDVRVVFHGDRSQAVPQVLITERDLPPPDPSKLQDKHHHPLKYTPPFAIHTVDADFADPFARHPLEEVAIVEVLVGEDGLPKDVHVRRGLGFGLDEKAEAAVWRYKFLPATKSGKPIAARRNIMVSFADF